MIDRLLIIIFFFIFLFIPLFKNISSNSNVANNQFSKQHSKIWRTNSDGHSYQNQIIKAIENISASVVGISVIKENNKQPKWEIKDGIFSPYTSESDVQSDPFNIVKI